MRTEKREDIGDIAYRWLQMSMLTWTEDCPSLAAASGLESPDLSRGEVPVMTGK